MVGHNRDNAELWGWWHEQVGWALFALILLHAGGALYHHYVRRDDIVRAMLPGYRLS
ncbi:MAG: cytochrome b/b6 domain-containing protein [Pseudomonadota bacterium]